MDAAATVIPIVPGGAATALKVARAGDKVADTVKAADKGGGLFAKANKWRKNNKLFSSSQRMGVEKASPELVEAISQKGRRVQFATEGSDELRMLDYFKAEASVSGMKYDDILLRENPSKVAALEEFLHGTQHRLGIIDKLGRSGAERHVKDFMIRHRKLLGLGDEDVRILKELMNEGL